MDTAAAAGTAGNSGLGWEEWEFGILPLGLRSSTDSTLPVDSVGKVARSGLLAVGTMLRGPNELVVPTAEDTEDSAVQQRSFSPVVSSLQSSRLGPQSAEDPLGAVADNREIPRTRLP